MKTLLSRSLGGARLRGGLARLRGRRIPPTPDARGMPARAATRAPPATDAVDAPAPDARTRRCGGTATATPVPDAGMIMVNRPEKRPFSPAFVQELRVPAGFRVQVFASGLGNPRMMAVAPEGDVYVTVRDRARSCACAICNGDGDASDEGEQVIAASADGDARPRGGPRHHLPHGPGIPGDGQERARRPPRAPAASPGSCRC